MNKLLYTISKYCFGTEAYEKRKEAKWRINFFQSLNYEVILKKWEHNSWGNNICANPKGGFYGFISNVRDSEIFSNFCDLKNGDILIYEVEKDLRHQSDGKRYDVGCLVNIRKSSDPSDLFFADFVRICFTDDISDVRKLVEAEIKRLKQYI